MSKETKVYKQLEMTFMDTTTYVYKSHNMIESGYNCTLNEQRLIYLAAKKLKPRFVKSNIKPSQLRTLLANQQFGDLRIYVNEFKEAFDLTSNNLYKILADTARSLKKKEINYLQDDGSFVEKSWVITSKYNKQGKYVELTFHPDLILDLLIFKGKFSKLQFNPAKFFKSSYTFRVYELLQNYVYKGYREIEVKDLRYKLGIYDNKYSEFGEFNRKILKPSIETINKYTELEVNYQTKKHGRKVEKISFTIKKKKCVEEIEDKYMQEDLPDETIIQKICKITNCQLNATQVSELTTYALESIKSNKIDMGVYEYIAEQTKRVEEYNKVKEIKDYYGALRSSIKDYWQPNITIPKQNINSFNNFTPREYDYEELEKRLLGWIDE